MEFYSTHIDFGDVGICNCWLYCLIKLKKHSTSQPRISSLLSVELFQAVNLKSVELQERFVHIYKH